MDSLKVTQQKDGQYILECDLTMEQLQVIVQEAIRQDKRGQL